MSLDEAPAKIRYVFLLVTSVPRPSEPLELFSYDTPIILIAADFICFPYLPQSLFDAVQLESARFAASKRAIKTGNRSSWRVFSTPDHQNRLPRALRTRSTRRVFRSGAINFSPVEGQWRVWTNHSRADCASDGSRSRSGLRHLTITRVSEIARAPFRANVRDS
jgi:hypothetical protein